MNRFTRIWGLVLAAVLLLSTVPAALAEEGTFPVEIEHAYGATVIESKPERVLTLYDSNPDAVLALGIAPVGTTATGYGVVDKNGLPRWVSDAFLQLGVEPNVFSNTDGINYEAVNDASPDLILLPNSGITKEEYARLSEIAPTVPFKDIAYACTWSEAVEISARALGLEDKGAQVIEETNALLLEKLAAYPELEGKTAAFCWIDPSNLSVIYIYMPLDPRAGFLEELGLMLPEEIVSMAGGSDYSVAISSENIDVLNYVDIIFCYGEPSLVEELQANDVINTVPAVANGAVVTISSNSELYIGTYVTALSIPVVIDEYLSMIAEAAAKVQ